MLFNPQTGEQIVHRMPIPDRPHDYWEENESEWPDDEFGAIRGYLDGDEPREHWSFDHHVAVLDEEQIDRAEQAWERWLTYVLNKEKIDKEREIARARATKRRERLGIGEFAKNSGSEDDSNDVDQREMGHASGQHVPAIHLPTSIHEKIQNIKETYSMFRDGALSVQEFEELKREILAS